MAKLTSRSLSTGVTGNDIIHIVNTSDISQSIDGSSYKATLNQLSSLFDGTYVTGSTFNSSTNILTLTRNDNVSLTTNLASLANDVYVVSGSYNVNTGVVTYTNSTGGTFTVSGFVTGFTDTYVTGGTYTSGTATFKNSSGGTFNVSGFYTGSSVSDTYVTGGTYTSGTATFTNNTGGTFNVTGFYTGSTEVYVTGGTYTFGTATFNNNTGGTFNVTGFTTPFTGGSSNCITDFYVTNVYGCSPITMHDYVIISGATSNRLGINTSPSHTFTILSKDGNSNMIYDDTTNNQNLALSGGSVGVYSMVVAGTDIGSVRFGVVGKSASGSTNFGVTGDSFLYSSAVSNGLNIISSNGTGTSDYIRFYAGKTATSQPDLHIQGSGSTQGYIGVGTTSPSEKLVVIGNTIIQGNLNVTGGTQSIFSGNTSSDLFRITQAGSGNAFVVEDSVNPDSSPFVVTNAGDVGIGTSSPQDTLHIKGNSNLLTLEGVDHAYMQFYPDGYSAGRKGWFGFGDAVVDEIIISNQTVTGGTVFKTNDITRMFISASGNSGNVGIGTSSPNSRLQVVGDVAIGDSTVTSGTSSHAEGRLTTSIGDYSHAEGRNTTTNGDYSHVEGLSGKTYGNYSHVEGEGNIASGFTSHAEGVYTTSIGSYSHTEGYSGKTYGSYSHAEGEQTVTSGQSSHAEGRLTTAIGGFSHSEGYDTTSYRNNSHAEGYQTISSGDSSHTEGRLTTTLDNYSHAEGDRTTAGGFGSHSEGYSAYTIGDYSHVEGRYTTTLQNYSHAEGTSTTAGGFASHSEGINTLANGDYSHAEGNDTTTFSSNSHAEGNATVTSGNSSHSEGRYTTSIGDYSHAEGYSAKTYGDYSHAEGENTVTSGNSSHAEGAYTTSIGSFSHAEGAYTIAGDNYTHSGGKGFNTTNKIFASGDTSFVHYTQTSASGTIGTYSNYSVILGGTDHNIGIGSTSSGIFVGSGNTISSSLYSNIIGGKNGGILNSNYSGVFAGNLNKIGDADFGFYIDSNNGVIVGGTGNTIYEGTSVSTIIGSVGSQIHKLSNNSVIIGGVSNTIDYGSVERSVILGGQNITASMPDYVYAPNMIVNTTGTDSKLGVNTLNPEYVIDFNANASRVYIDDTYTSGNYVNTRQLLLSASTTMIPAIVATDGIDDISIGVRGRDNPDSVSSPNLGNAGEVHLSTSGRAKGLNIVKLKHPDSSYQEADWIRFYAGQSAASGNTPDIHIHGSGATRGYVGIGTKTPTQQLDVSLNARFRTIGSSASAGALHYTADGTLTTNTSDIRLKTNILTLQNSLEKVKNLRGVSYDWIEDGTHRIGFIAQEINEVVPELTFINENSPEKYMGVHYDNVTALLVESIKEMSKTIEDLKEEIRVLKNR